MQGYTVLNRCSGDPWVFLPTCPKQCTKDPLLCSRLWDEFQDLLIYAFAGIGFPSWTSPAPTLHSYLDSAIVTCQPPGHDGTQGLPRHDCCSFPSQFFLTLDPMDITPGKGFCCFHSQVSLRVLVNPGKPHQLLWGLSKTPTVCLFLEKAVKVWSYISDLWRAPRCALIWGTGMGLWGGLLFFSGVLAGIALQSQNKIHYPGPGAGRYTAWPCRPAPYVMSLSEISQNSFYYLKVATGAELRELHDIN